MLYNILQQSDNIYNVYYTIIYKFVILYILYILIIMHLLMYEEFLLT